MPQVPRYEQQVGLKPAQIADVPTNLPASLAGGGASADRRDEALNRVMENEVKLANEATFLDADAKASKLQVDLEGQAKQMLGKDAASAPDVIQKGWQKGTEEILKGVSGQAKNSVQRALQQRYASLYGSVQDHVINEGRRYREQSAQDWLAASQREAAANYADPAGALGTAYSRQAEVISGLGKSNGWSDQQIADKIDQAHAATLGMVIDKHLDANNVEMAKKLFDAQSDGLLNANPEMKEKLATRLQGLTSWNKVGAFVMEDGKPDEAKMRAAVMADDSVPGANKEKVWEYVKGRAGEMAANTEREQNAQDRSFLNAVLQNKTAGAKLDVALKLADGMGRDDYDRRVKADLARKLYAPSGVSDPVFYVNLWERVQAGGGTKKEIDDGLLGNRLSPSDWESLRKSYYERTIMGENPAMKDAWDRVKLMAEENYPHDQLSRSQFIYSLKAQTEGKKPEELLKLATDSLKSGSPQDWKTYLQRRDAENLTLGETQFSRPEVQMVLRDFGAYGDIKKGTPIHNAVTYLMRNSKPITARNIRTILDRYPDGNVRSQ